MKGLKKRFISMLMVLVMVFSMLPLQVFAASNPMTVTVVSTDGSVITGATVSAYAFRLNTNYKLSNPVESGNGRYYVYRDNYRDNRYTISITVSAPGYETTTVNVRGSTTSTTIRMTPTVVQDEWQEFEMFYYLNGSETKPFPDNYAAAGNIGNYGPSGDNTPFVILNVNITALRQNYSDVISYGENTAEGNTYQFTPVASTDRMTATKAFWDAVLACADEESLAALEATGLKDWFIGYVAKFDGNSYHIDGILEVTPPVYSIELYKDDTATGGSYNYVGGLLINDGEEFKTVDEVLTALEGYLGYTITWQEENGVPVAVNGVYTGTYIHEKRLHTITVYQANANKAQPVAGSEIPFEEKSDYYYVAYFVLNIKEGHQVEFTVTYTDGDANDTAFYEHSYGVSQTGNVAPKVPGFTGVAQREGYFFLGWILEGGDGSLLSDSQIQAMDLTRDMVFHAVWEPKPVTHIGAVHVVLNGTYDATTHSLTSGTYVDIDDMSGKAVELYLKEENGNQYILLEEDTQQVGIYTAILENGNYSIFYSVDGGTTMKQIDEQILTINNKDRHRYLFFNSVEYDLAGGEAAADFPTLYYMTGRKNVYVNNLVPTRDRYVFSHWVDQYGNTYKPGDLLTGEITQPYTLTAQWVDAVDLYLDIQIKHIAADGVSHNNDRGMHDIFFTLDQRTQVGDYVEIYTNGFNWDGVSQFDDPVFEASYVLTNRDYTTYTSKNPVKENVLKDAEYTFTTTKSGYSLESVEKTVDENGDITVCAVLIYDPNNFDFTYTVRLDEEAKALPDSFKPVAVNVKVTSWYDTIYDEDYGNAPGDETVDWYTISQQRYTYERVALDANGMGTGSYPVWIGTTDHDTPMTYHYRIEVVSYEMPDGSINPAINLNGGNVTYLSDCKHVEANIVVTGGKSPEPEDTALHGAYYENGQQVGQVEAVISIHTYSVTFVPNGGILNGTEENTVVEPLFQVPYLHDYEPTREGGYVFEGWYLADENGQMTNIPGESYATLYSDVTLIAKWKEPLTITANIIISTVYEQENADGSVTVHAIHAKEKAPSVVVSLQRIHDNGYAETIATLVDALTYFDTYGEGEVTFTQVPNDGHTYRVLVITPNYTFIYQHEPDSLDASKKTDFAGSYAPDWYTAVFGDDNEAVINAYGQFTPKTYDLKYEVDADAIGHGFHPENAEIIITHDDDEGIREPNLWPVISQMEFGNEVIGIPTEISATGYGSGSFPAWKIYPDGRTAEYALRVQSTTTDGVTTLYDANTAPFSVIYHVPAYYVEPDSQSQMLIAELIPNTYPIHYELNGGNMLGYYTTQHTWSYDTYILAMPYRTGYIFEGWYWDAELTQAYDGVIDASVHAETTLYAKWKLAQDQVNLTVIIDHMQGNDPESSAGQAAAYDRILHTQLMYHPDGGDGVTYIPAEGTEQSFDSSFWHTEEHGTAIEEFAVYGLHTNLASDLAYSAMASMEGYEIVQEKCSVTPNYDEENENGTTYDVVIYLKYNPELVDLNFTVRMDEAVDEAYDPAAAQVKITSWYNEPTTDYELDWHEITQHQEMYLTVPLDDATRSGEASYSVWQWYLKEQGIPFFYRIEVVGLVLDDGTVIEMNPQDADVSYTGGVYTATVYAENGAEVPVPQEEGFTTELKGAFFENGAQVGTLEAVITVGEPVKVIFHSNNNDAQEGDIFRSYYTPGAVLTAGNEYYLTADGGVEVFYDIPTFAYTTHNGYIFKGWYMGTEEDAAPMDWNAVYTEDTHIYAHWIFVGEVQREEDGKIYISDKYSEYDLLGNQIRTATIDDTLHYGDAAPGLRFVASLSERVYQEMNLIHAENNDGIEYGFIMAFTNAAMAKANGEGYELKYKHASLNGEDTTKDYSYVNNIPCRVPDQPVDDHFAGESYRLYTAVITYNGLEGDQLVAAQNTNFVARAYLRYFDANGLERVHYNNYTGDSALYGCVDTNYNVVQELVKGAM